MGNATGRAVHIDKALSNMALGYRPEGFIADMIFPTVRVGKQSDLYNDFSRADRLRIVNAIRAPGTPAKRVTEDVGSATYFCPNYALARPVPIEDKANADPMLLAELYNGKAQYILDLLALGWEARVATQVTATANVGSSSAVTSGWGGAGDPLGNINQAIDNLVDANAIASKENVRIVFGEEAMRSFKRDSTVRNLILGTNNGGGYPNVEQVRQLLDVGQIHVGGAFQNTGEENLSEALSSIWKDNVLVYYAPTAPSIDKPSFGYNFRWAVPGVPDMQVERHPYDSVTKSELVEVGYYQQEKITGKNYSFLLTAVNSSS